jgi:NAD(P)-dependent dehydrogenase (short-subunit alcohol dehydrogenase family)
MTSLLDSALDRAVVPGYSKIGYWLRRQGWPEDDPRPGSLAGKRALVTGANSGLGKATALGLARFGATVHLVVRNEERGRAALAELAAELPDAELHLERCDLSDLDDVRRFAADLLGRVHRVDVLVHNAGALPAERTESPDGHEVTVATHVLGPVLLTDLLRPVLAGHDARVVLVSSGGMYTQKLPVSDPDYRRGSYQGAVAYARSKRMQVALTPLLQQRWGEDGIAVHAMHPGWADTPGVASSLPLFRTLTRPVLRDAESGADTVVWLAATEPPPEGGRFWQDRAERPTHYRRATQETDQERRRMWQWVLDATGLEEK